MLSISFWAWKYDHEILVTLSCLSVCFDLLEIVFSSFSLNVCQQHMRSRNVYTGKKERDRGIDREGERETERVIEKRQKDSEK